MTTLTLAKGLNQGLHDAMDEDPQVLMMGEDIGKLGGVFRITEGLLDDFGADRITTPLAEAGIIGTAIGLSAARLPSGLRDPVRRLRLPGHRPDHQLAGSMLAHPRTPEPAGGRAHPPGEPSVRPSIIPSRPKHISSTPPACMW